MANFTGLECIICKEKFTDHDDIVVCPQCGTPYHRECYAKEGSCVNTKLHEEHKSFAQEQAEAGAEEQKRCSHCNTLNKPHAIICENCGASLVDNLNFGSSQQNFNSSGTQGGSQNINFDGFSFNPQDKYCGLDPTETFEEEISVSEAADFIGTNTPYYLMLFKRMKETGKKITLNLVCIFFPQLYFANRKMWMETLITIFLTTILSIPSTLYMLASDNSLGLLNSIDVKSTSFELISRITNFASMGVSVLACLLANWLYYRHMIRKIRTIKSRSDGSEGEIKEKIQCTGGTSLISVFIAFAIQMTLMAAITWIIVNI